MSSVLAKIDRALKWSFYAVFFITPLIIYPKTFELFEFNKMWFVYSISLFVLFLWASKMIISQKFIYRRTPFDIPIILFLISMIISTYFSIDSHVSFWGYYSRFNGGLLSIITYIFLYYAFVSNFIGSVKNQDTKSFESQSAYKFMLASLFSGFTVAIWGFSSHFGYDLTCLVFRGTFDVSCWTDAFQPTVRLFSTLGQPNWLAAYFSILIPVSLAIGIYKLASYFQENESVKILNFQTYLGNKKFLFPISFFLLSVLLFIEVLWTSSQSGYLGILSGLFIFTLGSFIFIYKRSIKRIEVKVLGITFLLFFFLSFFLNNPLANRFPFLSIQGFTNNFDVDQTKTFDNLEETSSIPALEGGGSDSGKIRLIVWTGAMEIFKRYPIFGSGLETFAYSYYKVKPIEHNLLSEWDYLYNRAHNEYLNYLSTTGLVGLGTYLLFILWFLFYAVKKFVKEKEKSLKLIQLGLVSSFITILVSNFFGFSVVVTNLYLFLIPGIFLGISNYGGDNKIYEKNITPLKLIGIFIVGLICLYFLFYLIKYWSADQKYNYGYNLQKIQEYVNANPYLVEAVTLVPNEPLYKDELSSNMATLAYLFYSQDQASQAAAFSKQAITLSDEVVDNHPNNLTFYKTRVRVFFTLAQIDSKYLNDAILAVERAKFLAPTDAKVSYNAGLLYGQKGDLDKAIFELENTLKLKPNYRDPRIALATFYKEKANEELNVHQRNKYFSLAKKQLEYILENLSPDDTQAKELLKSIE